MHRPTMVLNPLSTNVAIMHPIMICLLTFLHTFSICLQHKMHRRRGGRPPAVHFMLQTNRKSVQKKLTSKSIQILCIASIETTRSYRVNTLNPLADDQQKYVDTMLNRFAILVYFLYLFISSNLLCLLLLILN